MSALVDPVRTAGPVLRIGILGAANIAPAAIVLPARDSDDVEVVAVAARRPGAAAAFAAAHGIPDAMTDYDDLLARSDLDLVYIATAASTHAQWAIAALDAGHHVLVEKPATVSAESARRVVDAADRNGRRLAEAFHYLHHPLFRTVLAVVRDGALGELTGATAVVRDPRPYAAESVLHARSFGGGALRHAGCYAVHALRQLTGAEPRVESADQVLNPSGADSITRARLRFDGVTADVTASFAADGPAGNGLVLTGTRARLEVVNFIAPQHGASLTLVEPGGRRRELPVPSADSYGCQLRAVVSALRTGERMISEGVDTVATAVALDAVEEAAAHPA